MGGPQYLNYPDRYTRHEVAAPRAVGPSGRTCPSESGQIELLGVVFVGEGFKVGAAAGFVEAGCADEDQLLALAEALGVEGGRAADHADGRELGDLVGDGHEGRDGAEGLGVEGGVEAGEEDALAEVNELDGEGDDALVEELGLVDADDI